jgi:zinc protease
LYFTQPRKDTELFKSFVSKQQALYQNTLSDPQSVFRDSVLKVTYGNHPRAPQIPSAETFTKIDEDRALAIYKERFGNANGFTFIFVGKVDPKTFGAFLETYLASLPSNAKVSHYKDLGVRPVKGVIKKEVHRGTEAKSFISMLFTGEAPYSDDEQLKLQAVLEVLNIKIIETLREDLSGIYGGRIFGSLSKYPYENYSIGVSLPCGPENVDKLIKATLGEIQKVKDKGPEPIDLNKVKENWKKQYQENLKDNTFWLRQLQQSFESGSRPADILDYEKKVSALTAAELKVTANKYFGMKNFIQMVLYPEK